MKRGFFLYVVVAKGATVLKLLASEYKALLIWRDALLVLDFGFDRIDRVGCFDVESDRFTRQRFHKYLHACNLIEIFAM